VASLIGLRFPQREVRRPQSRNRHLNARIRAWWIMCGIFPFLSCRPAVSCCLLLYRCLLCGICSLSAPRARHRRFLSFFVLPVAILVLVQGWYGLAVILIPVYASCLSRFDCVAGETTGFLIGLRIQWGLMVCVYCISYAAALLTLTFPAIKGRMQARCTQSQDNMSLASALIAGMFR